MRPRSVDFPVDTRTHLGTYWFAQKTSLHTEETMNPEQILDTARRRTARAWMADGVTDLAVGWFYATIGAIGCVPYFWHGVPRPAWALASVLVGIAGVVSIRRIVRRAKDHIASPADGYAVPSTRLLRRRLGLFIIVMSVAVVGGFLFFRAVDRMHWDHQTVDSAFHFAAIALLSMLYVASGWVSQGYRRLVAAVCAYGASLTVWAVTGLPSSAFVFIGFVSLGLASATVGVQALQRRRQSSGTMAGNQ